MGEPQRTDSPPKARDRILDAAEEAFAEDGFSGASMKAIAVRAGVAQGLLHYHFDGKEGLYAAVIERRSGIINTERLSRLDAVNLTAKDAVQQIMTALLAPPLGPAGGGRAYARIFAGLAVGESRDAALVEAHYDPTAKRFITALQAACPQASASAISWGYNLAIGALVATVARNGRPERLIGAEDSPQGLDEVIAHLVTYATGGLNALIDAEP
ncbi:TetR/AcrR family transcriptional regulator [Thalassococcus sp. S3]|uniref:TetR/AcrR family transcriptional regulator n=1 Tax=Thalassococcus sp. S3 TaxID=2017482 RepID=UPI0010246B70|nr:TetR/AcrR family transcriptional regulator [Thalassococcus sp. S3]QBF30639.1 TetR family transcriptional regulator [Thalassococcus sp. S3]